jgi:hypothetical protein
MEECMTELLDQEILSRRSAQDVGPGGLAVVRGLLARLHEADLAYCHWKSNEHLEAAIEGLTDLDILVDRRRDGELRRILAESGFKRFVAPPLRAYPGIEDYLALDRDTGRLVHLHLHHRLTLGERHLKGYRLPWEARLLATRRLDPATGVYVADPAIELVLLLVRAALKRRARDRIGRWLRGSGGQAGGDFARELAWLRERVDDQTARETACALLGEGVDEALRRLLAGPLAPDRMAAFAAMVRPALQCHRTYGRLGGRVRAWLRELQWLADAANRRYLHRATPLRRVSPRGGTVIALVGSDGSGKSVLARVLAAWLGAKLDVLPVYFGSGDGPSAPYRLPLKLAHRLLRPALGARNAAPPRKRKQPGPAALDPARDGRLRAAARVPWALALSLEKRGKLRRMVRARDRGMIVVCDRFPQTEIPGFNDGPLLAHWRGHPSGLCRALAAWEARPYVEAASSSTPDLVIKLAVTPIVALARRPEMSFDEVVRRVRAVHRLRYPPPATVVEIDADAPFEQVTLEAKRLVWDEV